VLSSLSLFVSALLKKVGVGFFNMVCFAEISSTQQILSRLLPESTKLFSFVLKLNFSERKVVSQILAGKLNLYFILYQPEA
jgi:hypothetical protein